MTDFFIKWLLILLLIFTPIAFGSQVLWAFSLMELGILLIIMIWAVQGLCYRSSASISKSENRHPPSETPSSELRNPKSEMFLSQFRIPKSEISLSILLLSLFLALVLLQMIPLPAGIIRIISPKTYEIRTQLSVIPPAPNLESEIRNPKSAMPLSPNLNTQSEIRNPKSEMPLSLFPLATRVEFFKWLALAGLFIFLLSWRLSDNQYRVTNHIIIAIFLVGAFESLYGIFEFYSGHRHILNLDYSSQIISVTGTFVNRNYFAGYLLMVIPLGSGFFLFREANQRGKPGDWRHRLTSLDGKTLLLGFGLILMILGLLLSASRGGIFSLLASFSMISLLFRGQHRGHRVSRVPVLILGLGLLWAVWIGLDAVISRFFTVSRGFEERWVIWANTLGILKDFPLLGSGLGTFREIFPLYRSFHFYVWGLLTHAENDFLQLASEVGFIGAALLLFLFLFLFYKAVSGIRSLSHGEPQRYIAIGGLIGILALMFHSTMERNLQVPGNAFLYTVIWAMVLRVAADSGWWPKGGFAASSDDGRRGHT